MRVLPGRRLLFLSALLLWAPAAHAHVEQGQAAGFFTGVGHPVSGLDHVLAMIAVGLWGAQLGAPGLWLLSAGGSVRAPSPAPFRDIMLTAARA